MDREQKGKRRIKKFGEKRKKPSRMLDINK